MSATSLLLYVHFNSGLSFTPTPDLAADLDRVRYPSKAYLLGGGVPGLVLHGDDFGSPDRMKLGTLTSLFARHDFSGRHRTGRLTSIELEAT
jgi:hypothetical protein